MALQEHFGNIFSSSSGLKKFTSAIIGRQIATGRLYYGKSFDISAFLPNFSDSMGQVIPGSSDFNQDLYNMLTSEEKQTIEKDKALQIPVTMLTSFIPFLSIYQNTREGLQEMVNIRHPQILKRAIERYNKKLIDDAEYERQKEVDDEIKKQIDIYKQEEKKELSNFEKKLKDQETEKLVNMGLNIQAPIQHIPVIRPVSNADVPINILQGRGLNQVIHERNRPTIFGDKELFELRQRRGRK